MAKIVLNEDLTPKKLATLSWDEVEWVYNALDVTVTLEVLEEQKKEADATTLHTYEFSKALMAPILEMNMRGTLIDRDQRQKTINEFRAKRNRLEKNFLRIVYEGIGLTPPFNWRSLDQLKFLLYTVMQLKPVKAPNANGIWTPTVKREALERLQLYFDAQIICRFILLLRELDKKLQFIESELDPDGRMRTSFNIAGTNTGRLSSSESDFGTGTNEQNIERPLRRMFVPDPGMKFCNIDLEQADARHVGALCWNYFVESHGEAFAGAYLDACESSDLHTTVCRMAWRSLEWEGAAEARRVADQIAYRDMSYRDLAKRLGHGTNYYGTPRTMAQHTKVETKLITEFQLAYFDAFPAIGAVRFNDHGDLVKDTDAICWHNYVARQIDQYGYIETPFYSRRRFFFGRPSDQRTLREAIAYAPQSMTADAIDTGIIRLWDWNKVQLLIQVHDSILFQYPIAQEAEIIPAAIEMLEVKFDLKKSRPFYVPAEAKIGFNWADSAKDNPMGLIKWNPNKPDLRTRPDYKTGKDRLTLSSVLNEKT